MRRSPFRTPPLAERVTELRRFAHGHVWNRLGNDQVARLLTDDWSGAGPLRLDETLSPEDLTGVRMLANARALLGGAREMPAEPRTGFRFARGPLVDPLHWTAGLVEAAGCSARSSASSTSPVPIPFPRCPRSRTSCPIGCG